MRGYGKPRAKRLMGQFLICKMNGKFPITIFWAFGALQPCEKSNKIQFAHEALEMGQKMHVYKPKQRSSASPISVYNWGIPYYRLQRILNYGFWKQKMILHIEECLSAFLSVCLSGGVTSMKSMLSDGATKRCEAYILSILDASWRRCF